MAQLAERLGLDLADPLAGHLEVLAHLLEGVVRALADAEAHLAARAPRGARASPAPRGSARRGCARPPRPAGSPPTCPR